MTPTLDDLPYDALAAHIDRLGVGAHHASRVFRALHRDWLLGSFSQVPDLGKRNAELLDAEPRAELHVSARHPAPDGSERLVFTLGDGARVEGVLLPNRHGPRVTLCLSSQVGCAMACAFCATGTLGLKRHLSPGEIVAQVHAARRLLGGSGRELSHLVFMGMGEPLHNFDGLQAALSILLDRHGAPFAQRNVTVSTVGQVPKLRRFTAEIGGRIQLALSLHAGTDATRRLLLPVAHRQTLAELKAAVLAHPLVGRQRWMVEYVLLPGVNDTPAELDALADWMDGVPGVVNLIPFNPFAGAPFRPPEQAEVEAAWQHLKARGVPNTVRWPRGRQAQGACGQLALRGAVTNPDPA